MRASGILMHISSLPSAYGIGTLGTEAKQFVDFLASSGQTYWQILPINPTGFGDSPYQAFSSYAGNHNFIDLATLVQEGLLHEEEVKNLSWGANPSRVDFDTLYKQRLEVLRLAYGRFIRTPNRDFIRFVTEEQDWLREYAVFMAIKQKNGGAVWQAWEEPLRAHDPLALREAAAGLKYEITFHYFLQYEFFRQWNRLREYCRQKGVRIIGDVPIYVPLDSCDVWANSRLFQLDENGVPTAVAGCPADQFNEDGQLWGNPLYNWSIMRTEGYEWWLRRLQFASRMFDVVRIDHFRGFESYWAVPYGAETAKEGQWMPGPGLEFVQTLRYRLTGLRFIAEDLGFLTPEVRELQRASGFPGMKVLEFAFSPDEPSPYLPHRYTPHCVCYAGTHDNAPLAQWLEEADGEELALARNYLGLEDGAELLWPLLRMGLRSVADVFIFQMQDALELGRESRMNEPGTALGNWRWRLLPGEAGQALAAKLKALCGMYGR